MIWKTRRIKVARQTRKTKFSFWDGKVFESDTTVSKETNKELTEAVRVTKMATVLGAEETVTAMHGLEVTTKSNKYIIKNDCSNDGRLLTASSKLFEYSDKNQLRLE